MKRIHLLRKELLEISDSRVLETIHDIKPGDIALVRNLFDYTTYMWSGTDWVLITTLNTIEELVAEPILDWAKEHEMDKSEK